MYALLLEEFSLNFIVRAVECPYWVRGGRNRSMSPAGTIEECNLSPKFIFTLVSLRLRDDEVAVERPGNPGVSHFFKLCAYPSESLAHLLRHLDTVRLDVSSHTVSCLLAIGRARILNKRNLLLLKNT